jgi:hypothetical protein
MNQPTLRPLGFGEILDGAFQLYRRHFATIFLTALIPTVPLIALLGGWLGPFLRMDEGAADFGAVGILFLWIVMAAVGYALMYAALARQFSQAYTGGEVSVEDGYRRALKAFPSVVAAVILVGVGAFAVLFALMMVTGIVVAVVLPTAGAGAGLVLAVILLLILVPVILVAYLGVIAATVGVLPPVVVERLGPLDAIGRWLSLARGAVWRVLGITLVSLLVVVLPALALGMGVGLGTGVMTDPDAMSSTAMWLQHALSMMVSALTYPFLVATFVLLYYDRRVRVEALDVQIAAEGLRAAP